MLRFGTDGVRGLANSELSPELVLALGRAAARVLSPLPDRLAGATSGGAPGRGGDAHARFLVGRDTRRSGALLQAALSAGLASEGLDVVDLGVMATPAVAYLSAEQKAPAAVISASHNPFWDNGVKFFSAGGAKLPDEVEQALEAELDRIVAGPAPAVPAQGAARVAAMGPAAYGAAVGRFLTDEEALGRYTRYVVGCLDGRRLNGLRVVLDCANGAAFLSAPQAFRAAGADVAEILADQPDGTNINYRCGSTDPGHLAGEVVGRRADLGLAFDGDADRVIAVDPAGKVVDGDRLLALFATDLAERNLLVGSTVVVTVMTNLGFHRAMAVAGVSVSTVSVGDRNVLEALDANGWALGGEQSGHIVFRSLATTGDGVLSGLLLADLVRRKGQPLDRLAAASLDPFPQVLRNVAVIRRDALDQAEPVWQEVAKVQRDLGEQGRVLLRPSGTEPVVRVMVEAPTQAEAEAAADRLVSALHLSLGSPSPR
ncbi:MAG TPA: phosphoglucosamine mutase [Acidimicrobiales bacterium]|nr:phosphoglucosamine mutase [Acidimicrobiales bacterium]